MASLNTLKVKELKEMAIDKGFKVEDIEELTKAQLIEILEETENGSEQEGKQTVEAIDSLKGFKGSELHVYEKTENGNVLIRTYSEEVHGEDFADLASSFVGKKASYFIAK